MNYVKKTPNFSFFSITGTIWSVDLQNEFKVKPSDFTRKRKLTFPITVLMMMNLLTKSLAIETQRFYSYIKKEIAHFNISSFTTSAFCQSRKKIKPEVFVKLSTTMLNDWYQDNDYHIKLFEGFRLLAIDGSTLTLPQNNELRQAFGQAKNQTKSGVVQARISVLYDVLNSFVIDGRMVPLSTAEKSIVVDHLLSCTKSDLLLYDRGYPSYSLIFKHFQLGINYLMRVKVGMNKVVKEFVASKAKSKVVTFYPPENSEEKCKPVQVRLLRIELPNQQEPEILATSLLDAKKYQHKIFKALYFKRWKIETFYDELKNKLRLQNFSGHSKQVVLQDFYAALFITNVQSIIVTDMEDEINQKVKSRKYKYKVNTNVSYGFLKERIIQLFFNHDVSISIEAEIKKLYQKHLVPIRPNRTYPRNTDKYRIRRKPKTLLNNKEAL